MSRLRRTLAQARACADSRSLRPRLDLPGESFAESLSPAPLGRVPESHLAACDHTSPFLFLERVTVVPRTASHAQRLQSTSECLAARQHGLEQVAVPVDPFERLAHPEATRRHVLRQLAPAKW